MTDSAVVALPSAIFERDYFRGLDLINDFRDHSGAGKRVAEVYVQVDEIFTFAVKAANQFGFVQGNVALPPDLQPVGLSLSSENGALEYKAYITNDLMQALVTGALQASQLMQGGGGGNNGGL